MYVRSGGADTSKTYEIVKGGGGGPKIDEIERMYFLNCHLCLSPVPVSMDILLY